MERKVLHVALIQKDMLATYKDKQSFKDIGISRGKDIWKIPVDLINVRATFNKRMDFADIETLAHCIFATGGTDPIKVDILKDGKCILIDGERRYRAYLLINSWGEAGFETMEAMTVNTDLTDGQRLMLQLSSNNSKSFTELEEADAFRDLKEIYGFSAAQIARGTGYSPMHVSNRLRLAGISEEEKDLISQGAVKTTAVVDMVKKGMDAPSRVQAVKSALDSVPQDEKPSKTSALKVKDVSDILAGMENKPLEKNATPEEVIKELLIHVKALDKLIGIDSKMSDITFKIDGRLRDLKRLISNDYMKKKDFTDGPF